MGSSGDLWSYLWLHVSISNLQCLFLVPLEFPNSHRIFSFHCLEWQLFLCYWAFNEIFLGKARAELLKHDGELITLMFPVIVFHHSYFFPSVSEYNIDWHLCALLWSFGQYSQFDWNRYHCKFHWPSIVSCCGGQIGDHEGGPPYAVSIPWWTPSL